MVTSDRRFGGLGVAFVGITLIGASYAPNWLIAVDKAPQERSDEWWEACDSIIAADTTDNGTAAETCLAACTLKQLDKLNDELRACLKSSTGLFWQPWLPSTLHVLGLAFLYRLLGFVLTGCKIRQEAVAEQEPAATHVPPDPDTCKHGGPFARGKLGLLPSCMDIKVVSDRQASERKLLISFFSILTEPLFDVVSLASYLRNGQPFYFAVAGLGFFVTAYNSQDPLQADGLVEWYRSYRRGFKTRGLLEVQVADLPEVAVSTWLQLYAGLVMTEPTQVLMLLFFACLSLGLTLPEILEARKLLHDMQLEASNFNNFYEVEAARQGKDYGLSFLSVWLVENIVLLMSRRWGYKQWHLEPLEYRVAQGLCLLLILGSIVLLLLRCCCCSPRPTWAPRRCGGLFKLVIMHVCTTCFAMFYSFLQFLLCVDVFCSGGSPLAEFYSRNFDWDWPPVLGMLSWLVVLGLSEGCLCALVWASLSYMFTSFPWKLGVTTACGISLAALWGYILQNFDWMRTLTVLAAAAQVAFHIVAFFGSTVACCGLAWVIDYSGAAEAAEQGGGTDTEAATPSVALLRVDPAGPGDYFETGSNGSDKAPSQRSGSTSSDSSDDFKICLLPRQC
ncbi:unnamed protein product [Symbiodinium sp. CCMP2592]|nr:unnamed protein product [Symbiodinium sp. CCMP2592]